MPFSARHIQSSYIVCSQSVLCRNASCGSPKRDSTDRCTLYTFSHYTPITLFVYQLHYFATWSVICNLLNLHPSPQAQHSQHFFPSSNPSATTVTGPHPSNPSTIADTGPSNPSAMAVTGTSCPSNPSVTGPRPSLPLPQSLVSCIQPVLRSHIPAK